jgi:hypothetical protein
MNESYTGDPIVDEVYAIRAEIAAECGYDIRRIAEHADAAAARIPGLKYITLEQMRERRRRRTEAATAAIEPTTQG